MFIEVATCADGVSSNISRTVIMAAMVVTADTPAAAAQ